MPEQKQYLISNTKYELLKKFVTLILPGFATLYAAVAAAWGWPNTDAVLATLVALAAFGGVLLKFAENSYDNSDAKYDGAMAVTGYDPDTGIPDLELTMFPSSDAATLVAKDTIKIKSVTDVVPPKI